MLAAQRGNAQRNAFNGWWRHILINAINTRVPAANKLFTVFFSGLSYTARSRT